MHLYSKLRKHLNSDSEHICEKQELPEDLTIRQTNNAVINLNVLYTEFWSARGARSGKRSTKG